MEWRAHTTQIHRIEADAKKHHQEVLTTTNTIKDAIQKNNVIFGEKWEMTHDRIDRRSEESDCGSRGLVWSPTKHPPILPKCYSWTGGDRFEVGCLGYHLGEVDLLLPRSSVVAGSSLRAGRGGGGRGDRGRGD